MIETIVVNNHHILDRDLDQDQIRGMLKNNIVGQKVIEVEVEVEVIVVDQEIVNQPPLLLLLPLN